MTKKFWFIFLGLLVIGVGIFGVLRKPARTSLSPEQPLKVGVTAGPHARIMEHVKSEAKKQGLDIEIIEFNDFMLPNEALNQGEIDVNCYQHQPFLDEQVKARGYKIHSIAKTVLMPMGLYSQSVKSAKDLPEGSVIGIPNDPTNAGRALQFLEQIGLIRLNSVKNPTVLDIMANPKQLKIKELDAPTLAMTLPDVTAAVINTDWVVSARLDPKSSLAIESPDTPYTNVLTVRIGQEKDSRIQKLVAIYQSDETKSFIIKTFQGVVIPGWGW
ncbi:MetQ/NlpA family ABC transporter substrate-binding protein [Candidatus Finniella inopinata]|uniref:Lipoprotein n=1 Tax=Candidatus Finniella inopinata TaxID=1696036 RepID=A0A4Q7DKY1_9PROT|nr:MetQ/NlpA family ABC transporter substrate-binding protein [Candidatus Finniella inopinata]RZI45356.1 MetQ/NlpA family ABC transporter substrate-binding protein [Candidatus Finniella inopinata]